ncbi:MAG: RdgB/HAM1 family non-canonical purine NTP pyrophosphatase [Firmicutes bacterium]|nr:RdgB/HAM1 family non-canonical purine NTP pyrophosphatase [Bacillota bacterium]
MNLILASNNTHKLQEFREVLAGTDICVISQREAGLDLDVDECGATFAENAWLKAAAVTERTGLCAVADDSGLVVDALNGAPGIYSARYGGSHGESDEYRYTLLLKNMQGKENRAARFVCAICCTFPDGQILRAEGVCEGSILCAPRGSGGFGYDPVFEVAGTGKSMAELGPEKNMISHRARALLQFVEELRKIHAFE